MKYLVLALTAAALFSTGGAVIKSTSLSPLAVASLRSGIAAAALLMLMNGRVAWTGAAFAVGCAYAATLVLFVAATKLTTAASAIFLQSTAPLYVALAAPVLLAERTRRRDVVCLTAVAAGLVVCFSGDPTASATAPDPVLGNLLGALCGMTWAATLLGLRWSAAGRRRDLALSAVVIGNLIAFGTGIPAATAVMSAPAHEWAALAYLGLFQIALAYVMLTRAVAHLPALTVSLVLLVEPVLNPIWTWAVHDERPTAWTAVGGTIIVAASAVRAIVDPQMRARRPSSP